MNRSRWSSRLVFLYAAIGSAVGLGNLWRFPYMTYKYGGGAFLIPYLIALFTIGIPLLLCEFTLGQKFQRGAIDSFKRINKHLGSIGAASLSAGFIVVSYYAVVMAWALLYLLGSFKTELPWKNNFKNYFFQDILNISESIGSSWQFNYELLIALFIIWLSIYFIIWNGVQSVGKVVKITMPLPIILLVILFFRGITLNGYQTGIISYLKPDFSLLLNTEIWLAATSQIFFTLSLGFGIMIAYSSYNDENQDVLGDSLIAGIANSAVSLFSGFVVFAILGYMATSSGIEVKDIVASGPGLAFIVFPEALSLMPWVNFFSVLFFVTLLTLGIDSAFSLIEAVNTSIKDKFPDLSLKLISLLTCTTAFLLGTVFTTSSGLYLLDIVDHFITNFGLVMVGLAEAIVFGWFLGADNIRKYINLRSKYQLGTWFNSLIKYLAPLLLLTLLVAQFIKEFKGNYEGYPDWAIYIGWSVILGQILIAVIAFFISKEVIVAEETE